jgi:hypothetical protein
MSSEAIKVTIVVAVAIGALYLGWRYRQKVRDEVSKWLRQRNLENSALMSALIVYDNIIVGIDRVRRRILVETVETGQVVVSEQSISLEELHKINPELYELAMQHGSVSQDVYSLVS